MYVEYSSETDAQWSRSDAVRCSCGGNAGQAGSKRFMSVGGQQYYAVDGDILLCSILFADY